MMAGEKLLEAFAYVDPELVQDARTGAERRNNTGRRALMIALAAALVLALGATAYGYLSGADWFKTWFSNRDREPLTQGQEAYIEGAAVDVGQRVTAGGWTVTVETALADQYDIYVKTRIDPPAGVTPEDNCKLEGAVVLDADGQKIPFSQRTESITYYQEAGAWYCVWSQSVESVSGETAYLDGRPLTLTFDSITVDGETVAEGPWRFTLDLPAGGTQAVELLDEPFPCKGRSISYEDGEITESYYDVTLLSLEVRPLRLRVQYRSEKEQELGDGLPLSVVLKDGTVVPTGFSGGSFGSHMADCRYQLEAPVLPEEIAYIQLPAGYTVPMPE